MRVPLSGGIVKNVAATYFTQIVRLILSLGLTVLVARWLGPEGRGVYALTSTLALLGMQFGNLGLPTAATFHIAKNPKLLQQMIGNSILVSFGYGTLFSIVSIGILFHFPTLVKLPFEFVCLAACWIPIGLAYLLFQSILVGLKDTFSFNCAELISKALPVLLLFSFRLTNQLSVRSAIAITILSVGVAGLWMFRKTYILSGYSLSFSIPLLRTSFGYAFKAYLASFFCFVVLRTDIFLVRHYCSIEQAGIYSISAAMADAISILATAIGTILFPRLTNLDTHKAKVRLTQKASIITALLMLPLLSIAALCAHPIVNLVFGNSFVPAASMFIILCPGILFLSVHCVAVQFLNSIGYPIAVVYIWGVCALFNITSNIILIPIYGAYGAAATSSLSYGAACLAIIWLVYHYRREPSELHSSFEV